jgi:hypothetical protein
MVADLGPLLILCTGGELPLSHLASPLEMVAPKNFAPERQVSESPEPRYRA